MGGFWGSYLAQTFDPLAAAQRVREFVINALPTSWGGRPLTDSQKQRIDAEASSAVYFAAGVANPNVPHSPELDARYAAVAQQQDSLLKRELAAVFAQAEQQAEEQEPWQTTAFWPLALILALGAAAYWVASR